MEYDYKMVHDYVRKLDDMLNKYESIWGVDRLPLMVSAETREKWNRQIEKLNKAIEYGLPDEIQKMVNGCLTGLVIMDNEAKAAGHKPVETIEAWYARGKNGKTIAVCRCVDDAKVLQGRLTREDNTEVYSLCELLNLQQSALGAALNTAGKDAQKTFTTRPFNFDKGDDLPF